MFIAENIKYIWAASWENKRFAYAKTKTQISCAVTAQLISAFVFATQIVQFLHFLNSKCQASSHLLWLYSLVCVGNPKERFSQNEAQIQGVQRRMVFDGQIFRFLNFVLFVVAIFDLVHDVETIFHTFLMCSPFHLEFFFWNMSDARETANVQFRFTGITDISETGSW